MLLAGFEPEDESPIVFLRLRKAARAGTLTVYSMAALASQGLAKLSGVLLPTVPGREAAVAGRPGCHRRLRRHHGGRRRGCGPRAAPAGRGHPGRRAAGRGAGRAVRGGRGWPSAPGPAWPGSRGAPASAARSRRARCRACCPAAAAVTDPAARAEVARAWGVGSLPASTGRDTGGDPGRRRDRTSCRPWSSPESTPPTCPIRPPRWRRWRRPASWSAWSCGSARSPTAPTWCSRSPRWPRRRARS